MAKNKVLKFRFKNEVERNGSDDNVMFGGRLIDKVERFKYLWPVV